MHHSTSGGSSETEVKELTVMPIWDGLAGGRRHHRDPGGKAAQSLAKGA